MFSILTQFARNAERRESKDEMVIGEVIRALSRKGWPTTGFWSTDDLQRVRFRTLGDPVLTNVYVALDRKTGGSALQEAILGSKATLGVTAEIKNYLSDPDDLVAMYKTDLQNLFKLPVMGGVRLNHELNSVFATTTQLVELGDFVGKGDEGARRLGALLDQTVGTLRDKLKGYKK